MKWFEENGQESALAVSTRIRLARNFAGLPFGRRLQPQQVEEIIHQVKQATEKMAGKAFILIPLEKITPVERQALCEKHLISPDLLEKNPAALLLSQDEAISVMINEEDHLRLQVMGAGIAPKQCLEEALRLDALLQESISFAYDENLGFLTQCPTNLGTGLRASVMLHLPLLTRTGQMAGVVSAASKVGLEIRGLYGEGSQATGELYQVSNSITLGLSEQEICEKLQDAVGEILHQEQALRQAYLQQHPGLLEDRVCRAVGLLRFARQMTTEEARTLLSDLRLGVACQLVTGADAPRLNQLIYDIAPACIELSRGRQVSAQDRDCARATLLRQALAGVEGK